MATPVPVSELQEIIMQGKAEVLVKTARRFGEELAEKDGLSKSQIRNIFGEVRRIEAEWQTDDSDNARMSLRRLLLLKPRMAYQKARESRTKSLMELLTNAIDEIAKSTDPKVQTERFRYFVEFFEAILAYFTAKEIELKETRGVRNR